MSRSRLDLRTLLLMLGAALIGAAWASYNRGLASPPYDESELRPLIWVTFAIPGALFLGWFFARAAERWWAAFVCFCLYFFSLFIAQRYESCTVVSGSFNLSDCFAATAAAQQLANDTGHVIHFSAVVVIQLLAAILITLHRALHLDIQRSASGSRPVDLPSAPNIS
jgi:hypothetical protein